MISWSLRFRKFRKKHGLIAAELGKALDLSTRAVMYIEHGDREPSQSTIDKFRELEERYARGREIKEEVKWDSQS